MREIKACLMDTVESSICMTRVRECKDMIINMHQPLNENAQEEGEVFAMDSDDEMALYEELDAMTEALDRAEEADKSWELVAAKNFNQVRACVRACVRVCVCVLESKSVRVHASVHAHVRVRVRVRVECLDNAQRRF